MAAIFLNRSLMFTPRSKSAAASLPRPWSRSRTAQIVLVAACLSQAVGATETADDDFAEPPPEAAQTRQAADPGTAAQESAATASPADPDGSAPAAGQEGADAAAGATRDGAAVLPPAQNKAEQAQDDVVPESTVAPSTPAPPAEAANFPTVPPVEPFRLLGGEVPPGEQRQLSWFANQHYSGAESPAQVLVAHGSRPGKVLCVTAAVHGDEINGVEIARRVFYRTKPKELAGTLVVVPITNLQGFERGNRYLADRRDLNRYFPGLRKGSSAARIAHSFFSNVIEHCDALVDLHTGSFHRTNLPQLRADLANTAVVDLTHGFGATAVLEDKGAPGTLRRAATDAGIPAVTLEAGEPMRLQADEVRHGTKAVKSLMAHLGMVKKGWHWRDPQPIYYDSAWVRAGRGGILMTSVRPGDSVSAGQVLGAVTDPISNVRSPVVASHAGRVIGMAVNQMVRPGYAVVRIGIERTEAEIVQTAAQSPPEPAVPPGLEDEADEARDVAAPNAAPGSGHPDE